MKSYIILSEKKWNENLHKELDDNSSKWFLINNKNDFTEDNIKTINPDKIFIPHWSYYIPEEIYLNYECIVFHETDLPFGRGGSPIQNLIERGYSATKISAIRVNKEFDAGDIYLKEDLCLYGTAEEIFIRANKIIKEMILEIINKNIKPYPQKGEATVFKRRKPSDGNIESLENIEKLYDYIRMLDADGYPKAFIETKDFRFEFTRASLKAQQEIIADVRIIKK